MNVWFAEMKDKPNQQLHENCEVIICGSLAELPVLMKNLFLTSIRQYLMIVDLLVELYIEMYDKKNNPITLKSLD